jgi:hypothetical protein
VKQRLNYKKVLQSVEWAATTMFSDAFEAEYVASCPVCYGVDPNERWVSAMRHLHKGHKKDCIFTKMAKLGPCSCKKCNPKPKKDMP